MNLSWTRVAENHDQFKGIRVPELELEYVVGNCSHPNGSVDSVCGNYSF